MSAESMEEASRQRCPACGQAFAATQPDDLCPRCLLLGLLDPAHTEPPATPAPEPKRGDLVGDYELIEPLGRGGMGVVWRARQRSLNRVVALKMIRTGEFAGPEEVRRFRNEAESAALLDHPNLVPIYEIGESAGRHFFSMRLVEGGSLATEPPQHRAPAEAAALVAKVARAVQFAHQRGVLHRDLKPGNILLDLAGEPLVADFGLARRLQSDSDLTLTGEILGSPAYMAPEQASGKPEQVTTAADVYSLGAILFEMLAGKPPFTGPTPLATLRLAAEQEPPRPRAMNPQVPRDLETICLKCLAKDPSARYASALALAEDLERWRRGEPIQARPVPAGERALKWAKRHPAAAGLVTLAILAPIAIIAVLLGSGARVRRFAAQTAHERDRTRENLYAADMFIAGVALDARDPKAAYEALVQHLPAAGAPDIRDFEWHWLWGAARGEAAAVFRGHRETVTGVAFSPDGKWLASCAHDGTVRLWPVSGSGSGRVLEFPGVAAGGPAPLSSVSFSPDGRQLLGCSSQGLARWDLAADTPPAWTNLQVFRGAFMPQAPPRMLLAEIYPPASQAGAVPPPSRLAFRDMAWREVRPALATQPFVFAVSADERRLAEGYFTSVRLWDMANGNQARRLELDRALLSLALSPDGTQLATCSAGQSEVTLWDAEAGGQTGVMPSPTAYVQEVTFSTDGKWIAVASIDNSVRIWDVKGRREIRSWTGRGLMACARALAFSPDNKLLATADADHAVRLWHVEPPPMPPAITNVTPPLAFSPDGRRLATGLGKTGFAIWDTATHELVAHQDSPEPALLAWTSNGSAVLAASLPANSPVVEVTRLTLARETEASHLQLTEAPATAGSIAFDPQRGQFITGHRNGLICWWDAASGVLLSSNRAGAGAWQGIALSPDAQRFAIWTEFPRVLQTWDCENRRPLATNSFPRRRLFALAFQPDGRVLATGGDSQAMHLWDSARLAHSGQLPDQPANVTHLAWSPRGRTLASASLDGVLRLWHVPTSRRLLDLWQRPPGSKDFITGMAFSPAGDWLAATDSRRQLRLWHAPVEAIPADGK